MIFTGERYLPTNFNKSSLEHVHRYAFSLHFTKDKIVVDIACGTGYGTYMISENAKHVTGIDISKETIDYANKHYNRKNLKFVVGNIIKIPLPSNSVDVVISFETIEHHDKHLEMILEIKRVLKKEGILIISTPDKINYSIIPKYNNKFHVKELTTKDFYLLMRTHFAYIKDLYQKVNYCSLITTSESSNFIEFDGQYNEISLNKQMVSPIYNIAIVSDYEINEPVFSSSFNGDLVLHNLLNVGNITFCQFIIAKLYRLGSIVKSIFKKYK